MLTRLRVRGFKNLLDADIRFGPVTCLAGPNGVGKSNIFDAIHFLSLLADKPFVEAARSIRSGGELSDLFPAGHVGPMKFDAEMLIPPQGADDFNQDARASYTYLRYTLHIAADKPGDNNIAPRLRLEHEELSYIPKRDAKAQLGFPHVPAWRNSVIKTSSRRTTFIYTQEEPGIGKVIRLQSDRMRSSEQHKRGGGKPLAFPAGNLPRTVLSSAQNAEETRTAVLARQEMRRWRQLQLEPSALRKWDDMSILLGSTTIDTTGAHLPAALYRLAKEHEDEAVVYTELSNPTLFPRGILTHRAPRATGSGVRRPSGGPDQR